MTDHRSEAAKAYRAWYRTKQWKNLRAHQLRQEPLCKMCKASGIICEATVADHITPHKGDISLFFSTRNLQSLCKTHHDSTKARDEARGIITGSDASGIPIDPKHHWNK